MTNPESTQQQWDATLYQNNHGFVWKYGANLIEILSSKPGERILDLGCGTGQLTNQIAAAGAEVIGIDNSRKYPIRLEAPPMRERGGKTNGARH